MMAARSVHGISPSSTCLSAWRSSSPRLHVGAWTGRIRTRAWIALVALQAVLLGGALVATHTGEREEDRVEAIVPHAALEQHEAYAEQFVWAVGATPFAAGLVPVFRHRTISRALALATVTGTLIVAASALRVGHAGGQLVYVHNAGAAYAGTTDRARTTGDVTRPDVDRRRHADEDR
jgi:hypothetical protein